MSCAAWKAESNQGVPMRASHRKPTPRHAGHEKLSQYPPLSRLKSTNLPVTGFFATRRSTTTSPANPPAA